MGECSAELLFDRQKETWGKSEHRKPHGCDWSELLVATECGGSHSKKRVGRNPSDDEPDGNGDGALGQGSTSRWSVN